VAMNIRGAEHRFRDPVPLIPVAGKATVALALWALSAAWPVPVHAAVGQQRAVSVQALGNRLAAWVADDDPKSHAKAVARVKRGVPPGALGAFLVAAREHPKPVYAEVIEAAARHRDVTVRGRALAAMAAGGRTASERAIARAADDHDRTIRRLAWALERMHPSPAAHEIVKEMLEHDEDLAKEVAAIEAAELEAQDEAEILVFDDEADAEAEDVDDDADDDAETEGAP